MSEVKTNKLSSATSNSDITLDPNGTGDVAVASGQVKIGTSTAKNDALLTIRDSGTANPMARIAFDSGDAGVTNGVNIGYTAATFAPDFEIANRDSGIVRFKTNDTERMRIDSSGNVLLNKTATNIAVGGLEVATDGRTMVTRAATPFQVNRVNTDGDLIFFRQDGTTEGTISVSGTTISYNGGHLARWSQLDDGSKDTTIVKGTVMTNLDQMAVWTHAATDDEAEWTEDNEQLNCMAVSSVEGDANVAGVFVNWDNDDDEFNDMNVAMTGDMVIRIAQGTTVARGDLLMSAGDGTAKPQGDDIVRSKTIAKVTSTTVSHTYDDGSYLVPCVLMAC